MLANKKSLPINQLKVGMLSANNINFENRLLLAKGSTITESAIKTLKQNYIVDSVEIYIPNSSEEVPGIKVTTAQELETAFNEFSSSLENVFNSLSKNIEELRAFSNKIQDEFSRTGLVIRDIIFSSTTNISIYRHSVNVSAIGFILGKWVGLNETEINLLTYSALLHDFGKTKINKYILNKKINLTLSEKNIIKSHPILGYNFVKTIPYLDSSVGYGVLMHHERNDGSGYPLGIKEEKIHKFAKIIAIADLFDNISSNSTQNPFDALRIIQEESHYSLDIKYCNMFLHHIINYCMGETVILNDDRHCKVIKVDINDLAHPLLLDEKENNFIDLKEEKNLYIKDMLVS
ncbi:HD-GYP domain-containing protein [Clostridium akagii]|uniref:HD-GYP domain-containing protein n=1 Tax=Clostridium akagii TaxID=91623 RepID=UPI00047B7D62|nr:HD-GYP domain-containing protein [Clostridium akagii]